MSEESPGATSGDEETPRKRPRKPAEPKTLPTTEAGEKAGDQFRRRLAEMVDVVALTEANRRRATTIDTPDYEAAFELIASVSRSRKAVVIVADVSSAVGAGLIGFAINIYTGGTPGTLSGHIGMLAGITMSVVGIVLKYVVPGR